MTVSMQVTKRIYQGNGVTRVWDVDFPLASPDDLDIWVTSPLGESTRVTENFSLNSAGTSLTYPTEESEQEPLAQGWKITLVRHTPMTQTIDLVRQGELDAEVLEAGYDKLTLLVQEMDEKIARSIKYPVSSQNTDEDADNFLNAILTAQASAASSAQAAVTAATEAQTTAQTASGTIAQAVSQGQSALQAIVTQADTSIGTQVSAAQTSAQEAASSAQTAQTAAQTAAGCMATKAETDLSNITAAAKGVVTALLMPDYANGIAVSNTAGNVWTRVDKDSFVVTWGSDPYTEDYWVYVSPDNGTTKYKVGRRYDDINSNIHATSFSFFVPKGWYFVHVAESGYEAMIYPLKGAQ